MPLLKGKIVTPAKSVLDVGPSDKVYVIPHTSEQFLSKEEFEKRQALYKEPVWTCQCTGVTKLTHKEATESEKRIRTLLEDEFPDVFEKPVLEIVHHNTIALENLVDEAWRNLHEFFAIGEQVTLRVKAHGKVIRGTVVKLEPAVSEKPISDGGQSITSGEKSITSGEKGPNGPGDSPRKAPKLRPCKYGVRLEEEDKIINCIPAFDLVRETKLPRKDLIRFFIRTHAIRSGNQPPNPWIVDVNMVNKYLLHGKPTMAFGALPHESQLKENIEKSKKRKMKGVLDENCKPSKKARLELVSGKQEKKKKKKSTPAGQRTLDQSILPRVVGTQKLETSGNECASKEMPVAECDASKAVKKPPEIMNIVNGLKRSRSVSSTSSSCEVPLAELRGKMQGNGGTALKQSIFGSNAKKSSETFARKSRSSGDIDSRKLKSTDLGSDEDSSSFDVPLAKLREGSWMKEGGTQDGATNSNQGSRSVESKPRKSPSKSSKGKGTVIRKSFVTLYRLAPEKSSPNKNSISHTPKKQLKQMTLFDMKGSRNNGTLVNADGKKTPQKSPGKSNESSGKKPAKKTPQESRKKSVTSSSNKPSPKSTEKTPTKNAKTAKETPQKSSSDTSCVKKLATPVKTTPRKSLPPIVLRLLKVSKETNAHLYWMLVSKCARELTDSQIQAIPDNLRSVILPKFNQLKEKKKLEMMTPEEREAYLLKKKEELREKMKMKFAESRKRFEDIDLDLQPLPTPKIVPTPDGLANELFGDVAMVAEFISCFQGLLMPGDSNNITSEKLMEALVKGKEGFSYLSRVLCILLQTLLQDKLAEEYKELQMPLSEIPVSEYTASELVRLCLRRFDAETDSSDESSSVDDQETKRSMDIEVPEAVIEQLESSEFCELDVESKIQVLVGLCNRIMGSYSVQDYMEEKQQEASELWKKKIAEQKEKNDKKKSEKHKKAKTSDHNEKSTNKEAEAKPDAAKGSGLTIEHFYGEKANAKQTDLPEEKPEEDEDMLSAIKRRRKAAEERKLKESEERILKEKEKHEIEQQKKEVQFDNQLKKGVALAKSVLRHCPIGLDRNHARYWIMYASQPGLYVEKGWASHESDYTVRHDMSSSSESDSDRRSVESGIHSGSSSLTKDTSTDKTVPHLGQNLWFMFDNVEDINALLAGLHPLGVRESALKEVLKKNYDSLVKSLNAAYVKVAEVADVVNGDEKLPQGLREEMRDLELRLVHGGLGGVSDLTTWEKKLSEATEIKDFVECLTDVQLHILPKFIKGLLATKPKDVDDSQHGNKSEERDVKEKKKEMDGMKMWLDALNQCSTFSRLHVLMGILESCIKWEKSAENLKCRICRKKGDEEYLLLCDECNMPFHLFCLRPVLQEVPIGEWFCPACSPERSSQKMRSKYRETKGEEESDDEDEGIADIEHEQECAVCGEENDLLQCSTCPSSFHMDCHDPPLRHTPRGNTWKCMQCKTGVRLRRSRRLKAPTRKHYIDYITEEEEFEEVVPTKKIQKSSTTSDLRRKDASEQRGSSSRQHRSHGGDDAVAEHQTKLRDAGKKEVTVLLSRLDSKSVGRTTVKLGSDTREIEEEPKEEPKSKSVSRRGDSKLIQMSLASDDSIEKQTILEVINRLRKHRNSWPFLEPVDVNEAPDYYTIISNPIDLRTMEDKCICNLYATPQQFAADFHLMLQNAEKYNEADSSVGKCIVPLDKCFESLARRFLPDCKYRSRQWFCAQL